MKLNTLLAGLLATFLLQHTALSQTNVAAADQSAVATDTNVPAVAAATSDTVATVVTNTPEAATPVAEPATPAAEAATNAPAEVAEPVSPSIPLIQFQDVPLTTAIENLARQANINYLLDPKISYGQPEANGQVKAEPTLSIRWENITAEHALIALLDNYGLQLVAGC